jgi:uncharacterized 2Fe-2S/4Fe-4S cluster protein (DUF4445 family)/predicted metal-binding protein
MRIEDAIEKAKEFGFEDIGIIDTEKLRFLPEVREMCASGRCHMYGKSWVCPPACGSIEEAAEKAGRFRQGILVQTVGQLEDEFDGEGMMKAEKLQKRRFRKLARWMRNQEECLPLSVGCCTVCESCTYPKSACRYPLAAMPSMEAYGLLVSEVCEQAGRKYYHGKGTISFVSCILFDKKGEGAEEKDGNRPESVKVYSGDRQMEYQLQEKKTLLEICQELGLSGIESPCGGKGSCGKCLVRIRQKGLEKEVLACQTRAEDEMEILLKERGTSLIAEDGSCYHYPPEQGKEKGYALACDIGTTSLVCHLVSCKDGKKLTTVSGPNAQKIFGGDVISRIQASIEGKLTQMQEAIIGQINEMIEELCKKAGLQREEITYAAIAGNTIMEHIFAGLKPDGMGFAPFQPESLFGEEKKAAMLGLQIAAEAKLYLFPAVAAYIGGDITADIIALQMQKSREKILLLDIGTNGEMALGDEGGILSCATAAGPAFEGGQISIGMPAVEGAISAVRLERTGNGRPGFLVDVIGGGEARGICGSGLIDALALMLELELIDESGCFAEAEDLEENLAAYLGEDEDGAYFRLTEKVRITQADVRKLQLAKAAVAAGIQVLLKEAGLTEKEIDRLILAGGFGSYLNPRSAAKIGLIPESLLDRTQAVGNAAGEGAVSAAISGEARRDAEALREQVKYVELSTHGDFTEYYVEAMYFASR